VASSLGYKNEGVRVITMTGRLLILIGVVLVAIGLLLTYLPGAVSWFGRLPGDIRLEGEKVRFYFPLTSLFILSIAISVVIHLIRRFW
jgi:hypothetical protein